MSEASRVRRRRARMRERHARSLAVLLALGVGLLAGEAAAAVKPRAILIVPFDSSALSRDEQWVGEGIAQVLASGLAQHPAFVQIDRARLRQAEAWSDQVVQQAARAARAEAALYGN